jgi:hypothetical protein
VDWSEAETLDFRGASAPFLIFLLVKDHTRHKEEFLIYVYSKLRFSSAEEIPLKLAVVVNT